MRNKIEYLVDTKTDAQRIFRNADQVIDYLEENGFTENSAIWDYSNEFRVTVEIPEWKEAQAKYCAAKLEYCKVWGCE